jgi:hypothetical protein
MSIIFLGKIREKIKHATTPPIPSIQIVAQYKRRRDKTKHAMGILKYYNHVQLMSTPDGSVRLESILRR